MTWPLLPQQVIAQLAFMSPNRLLILVIIPLLILAYIFASLRKNRRGMRFTNTSMLDVVVPKQSQWRRHLAVALSLLSLITLTAAFARPTAGTFGNGKREEFYNPGQYQWDIALFKNVSVGGSRTVQFRAEIFNFLNHPNWNNVDGTTNTQNGGGSGSPTTATFGRVTSKDNSRRDIQLSLRFLF